jgi:hypothetical protein
MDSEKIIVKYTIKVNLYIKKNRHVKRSHQYAYIINIPILSNDHQRMQEKY